MGRVRRGERIFGAALGAVGLFALYQGTSLPLGSLSEPDAGFFPVVVAIALILFALLALKGRAFEVDRPPPDPGGAARVAVLIGSLGIYGWLLPLAGFVPCTIVLLGILLRGLGDVSWSATIVCAVTAAVGCYFLFTRLGLPLPSGALGF